MTRILRGLLIVGLGIILFAVPLLYYRAYYANHKRFRTVAKGKLYRSGQLTQDGFVDAVRRYNIKTVINLQEEPGFKDPAVYKNYFNHSTIAESQLCKKLGVRYEQISLDLHPPRQFPSKRPKAIQQYLTLMDDLLSDPSKHPVLIHCRAGLHRTGCMAAVYRMEYQGWTPQEAYQELKANGFGDRACTWSNEYVRQYVLGYEPRKAFWGNSFWDY